MLTGILSLIFCSCNLLFASYIPDSEHPTAQTSTIEARLEALILDENDAISVSIQYILHKSAGLTQIAYSGLEAFGTQIKNIKATFNTERMDIPPHIDQLKIGGQIDIPESLKQDTSITFTLNYEIHKGRRSGNEHFDIFIPVLWIDNSDSALDQGFFEAHLVLPEEYYIKESFPATVGPCLAYNTPRHSCLNLQVIPTFLRFRGRIGHNPMFTAIKVIDYSILGLLAATCIFIGFLLTEKHLYPVSNG